MDYHRITDETHPALNKIKIIYEEAFPLRERRDFQQLVKLTSINYMRLVAIEDSSTFLGFFIQWEFEKFNYIEHIAIDPLQRGKNYGSTIMKQIIDSNQKTLLLEVEPEETRYDDDWDLAVGDGSVCAISSASQAGRPCTAASPSLSTAKIE